jgi:hypothetical protein
MSEQNADIQRNISLLLGDDKKGSGAVSAGDEVGRSDPLFQLRSLERIRFYRRDGSSYSVPYSDVDRVELSADGQESVVGCNGMCKGNCCSIWQICWICTPYQRCRSRPALPMLCIIASPTLVSKS